MTKKEREYEETEESEPLKKVYCGTFKSVEALEKGYSEAQKRMNKAITEAGEYQKVLQSLESALEQGADPSRLIGQFGATRDVLKTEILIYNQALTMIDKIKSKFVKERNETHT